MALHGGGAAVGICGHRPPAGTGLIPILATLSLLASPVALAANDVPVAVASIKPVHSLLSGVMKGVGTPKLLVRGGASPHAFALKPSDARILEQADIVVWIGEGLETFLPRPLQSLAGGAHKVELSRAEGIVLERTCTGTIWEEEAEHHGEEAHREEGKEHGGEKAHREEKERHGKESDAHAHREEAHAHRGEAHKHREDGHEHAQGEFNMHVWLHPENASVMVRTMVAGLSKVDPSRAAVYRANGDRVIARLRDLDAEIRQIPAPVTGAGFIVFHDAWHYFDKHYGLRALGSITASPEDAPGTARLVKLRKRLVADDVACIFVEPQFESRMVTALIVGTDTGTGKVDPLGAALEDGENLYFELMRSNAHAFRKCLQR